MKFVIAALTLLNLIGPATADDDPAMTQLRHIVQCQAVDLSLMQMHNQIAASFTTLSDNPPKEIVLIKDSYLALAKEDQNRLMQSIKVTNEVILPSIKDNETTQQILVPLLNETILHIQHALGTMDYDGQVKVQTSLLKKAQECETMVSEISKSGSL